MAKQKPARKNARKSEKTGAGAAGDSRAPIAIDPPEPTLHHCSFTVSVSYDAERAAVEDALETETEDLLATIGVAIARDLGVSGTVAAEIVRSRMEQHPTVPKSDETELCETCGGTGGSATRPGTPCAICGGTGHVVPDDDDEESKRRQSFPAIQPE